jgi:aryl-alcohol dehydrogenase-like predicted oxidoreductase
MSLGTPSALVARLLVTGGGRQAVSMQDQYNLVAREEEREMFALRLTRAWARCHGHVALAWMLRTPVVSAPIIGATKPRHLTDAVAALDVTLTSGPRSGSSRSTSVLLKLTADL